MSAEAALPLDSLSSARLLDVARRVVRTEAEALLRLADRLGEDFCRAVRLVRSCRGTVVVAGVGKAGRIAQKIADTLCSTGTLAHFLHPADAVHGDLGRVRPGDVVIALSKSGATQELNQLLAPLAELAVPVVAITADRASELGRRATVAIELGRVDEACHLGLAPSTSTTVMLAAGDALVLVVSQVRGFTAEDFARAHPGGSLGRRLSKVEDHMRKLAECRVASERQSVRRVLIEQGRPGRRVGAVMLCGEDGRLTGFLTDSDIARLLESGRDAALDGPACDVMTHRPRTIQLGERMTLALETMQELRISELPVVDEAGRPIGMLDRADFDCFAPVEEAEADANESAAAPRTLSVFRESEAARDEE